MKRPETRYAEGSGVSIAYQVWGEGPRDLIIIPGFVSNLELWWANPLVTHWWERMGRFARVICFDKRGTGLSDPVAKAPTLEERADDVHAVMDAAGSSRAWLFGLSEGGVHGMVFAASNPDRVAGLILYGTFVANQAEGKPPILRDEANWEIWNDAIDNWGEGRTVQLFTPSAANKPLERQSWALWERSGGSRAIARQLFDLMWNVDVSDVVEHVSVPTLAIHFTDDFINVDNAHWITDRIPGAQLAILPGGSHVPADIAGVDLVVDEIERFVTGTVAVREEQRMLATVLFTDIVGSTEHAAALGDVRWRQIVNAHDQIFRDQLAEHRGREIKSTGDGFLAIFPTPARAVRCARAFTAAVADLDISVRAGVHSGEIELVGEDIAGLAVAIAARVSALACAGQVLVTTTVRDLTFGSDLAYEPRGEHLLKGVPGSWTVLEAVAEHQPTAGLLPTSEPAGDITGRLLRQVAFRSPRIARLTTRSVQRLPTPPGPWARKRDLRGRHRRDGRAPDDETGRDR